MKEKIIKDFSHLLSSSFFTLAIISFVDELHNPNGDFPGNPGDYPADILVADAFDAGQPVALDISIVHPLMPSRVITTIAPGDTAGQEGS